MSSRSLLVVIVLASLTVASASAALAAPVIHEPWTPVPCPPRPTTTLAITGCLEHAVSRSDRVIDAKVANMFRLIRAKRDRVSFVMGEQLWLSYRRQSCTAAASGYRGGSVEPVVFLQCEKRLNVSHIADLTADEQMLRHK